MAQVLIRRLNKMYGDVHAVIDVNIEIRDKEFVVLVGPSGCGKTTTLRMIAGLESITSGEIAIGNTVVNQLPPMDRDIAMVFQNYALYPHMSVYDNMGFGLRMRKFDRAEIKKRVQEALRAHFRPEFLNRIDEVVIFKRLNDKQLSKIVDLQLSQVARRLEEKKIRIELSDSAKAVVAKEGYDPAFGARPLKRALQRLIVDPLAKKVIAGEIRAGSTVKIDFFKKNGTGELIFSAK